MNGFSISTQFVHAGERRAASVGDIFTGIVHPATATHREMSSAKRARLGITEGLLRISAGIEEVEDIIADIKQAFEAVDFYKLPLASASGQVEFEMSGFIQI